MNARGVWLGVLLAILVGMPALAACAEEPASADSAGAERIPVPEWLLAGPMAEAPPLFDGGEPRAASGALLDRPVVQVRDLWPRAGEVFPWSRTDSPTWARAGASDGHLTLTAPGAGPSVAWLAVYLESGRWQKVDLVLTSRNVLAVFLDGEEVSRKASPTRASEDAPETVASLEIPTGKARVLIRTAASPEDSLGAWDLTAVLRIPKDRVPDAPQVSLSPERTFARLSDLSAMELAGTAILSPDGTRFVVSRSRSIPGKDEPERALEVRSARDGTLERTLTGVFSPVWSPDGSRLVLMEAGEEGASNLRVLDLKSGSFEKILEGKKSLSNVAWTEDGASLLFTAVTAEKGKEEPKYEKLTEPYMRWPDWNEHAHLWVVSLESRVERPLAVGDFSVTEVVPCPGRPLVAFVRNVQIDVRPFEKRELWTLDLESGESRMEGEFRFGEMGNVMFDPRGERLAWVASPSQTDTLASVPDHNAYEQDLYLWDRKTKTLTRLSDRFDPSVGADLYGASAEAGQRAWWNPADGRIYFTATHGGKNLLYRADPSSGDITHLPTEPTAVYGLSGSADGKTLLFTGSRIDRPPRIYRYDIGGARLTELLFPGDVIYKDITLGRVEPWTFTNSRGEAIEGWIHFPPGFDPTRKYPTIVYYYGGVFPNGEAFHWRTSHLAANGYVVYVLNPVGSVGYGPEFADLHVNDWGERAAADVIEGVERLTAEKPYVDAAHIGCFGGSYGGFLTEQILTKTDLFAAAEASFGISNITSYWGEGRWGYTYGDVAMARSYPWNRPDIFVERSPLFKADRIHTPLLLTHGTGDTNVPSGESDQMFTALRVLRKDVVYVRFPGQEHGIGGTQAIRVAHNEIRLAWFDKYLKDQPESWEARWEKK